jgi:ABC-2 type transport system ATP-binding protein
MIEIQNLTKRFGIHNVLNGVSLSLPRGVVLGVVGAQGAGKTTLLKIMATLVEPTSGDVFIDGASVLRDAQHVRRVVGYLSEELGVYPDLTCSEYVQFFAATYGVPANERAALTDDLLQLVDLYHRKDTLADRLTRGMKHRLGIARLLAHDPQVLLLDELFAPLDPRARVETRELIRELVGMSKTIIITGGSVAEMQDVCTHVIMLRDGRVDQLGVFADYASGQPPHRTISVKFLGDAELSMRLLREGTGVVDVTLVPPDMSAGESLAGIAVLKELRVVFNGNYANASALLRSLMHSGVQVVAFAEEATV